MNFAKRVMAIATVVFTAVVGLGPLGSSAAFSVPASPWPSPAPISMNYGHFPTALYTTAIVQSDFGDMWAKGVRNLRLMMPGYNSPSLSSYQALAVLAKQYGFRVSFGVTAGSACNSSCWNGYSTSAATLVPWAIANNIDELEVGNEEENHCLQCTATTTDVENNVKAQAAQVKAAGFTGSVVYDTLQTQCTNWAATTTSPLSNIGFNLYGTNGNFQTAVTCMANNFPTAFIGEFNTTGGATMFDYTDKTEWNWANQVDNRKALLTAQAFPYIYFFTWRDGGQGVTADTYGFVSSDGHTPLMHTLYGH